MRSLRQHLTTPAELSLAVLYAADNEAYEQGYQRFLQLQPGVTLQKQDKRSINAQIFELASVEKREFFTFFTDDIVVVRPFGWTDRPFQLLRARKDIASVSLRLNPRVDHSQPLNLDTAQPRLDQDLVWSYRFPRNRSERLLYKLLFKFVPTGDWAGSMFIDGYVFRHAQFLDYFPRLPELKYVTQIESVMLKHPLPGNHVVCYPQSRLVNVVMNQVDKNSVYPHGGGSVGELNQRFLAGDLLDDAHLRNLDNRSCHLVLEPQWVKG